MAVVLTLVQTKQIRINTHKRNNTKNTVQTIQTRVNTSTHITKTPIINNTRSLNIDINQKALNWICEVNSGHQIFKMSPRGVACGYERFGATSCLEVLPSKRKQRDLSRRW